MKLIRIDGELFFGAVSYVAERLDRIFKRNPEQKHLLILARPINFIDMAGAELLVRENRNRRSLGGGIYFHQLKDEAKALLERGGYVEEIGADHFYDHKGEAIAGVFEKLDKNVCARCTRRIFNECKTVPRAESVRDRERARERDAAE